jgi:hypothetical protein
MNRNRIYIKYIQNYFQVGWLKEFIVIFNGSSRRIDLKGWKVNYKNIELDQRIFTYNFYQLKNGNSFDPAESLCLISGHGDDHFHGDLKRLDFYTDHNLLVMNYPKIEVQLLDNEKIIDTARIVREKIDTDTLLKEKSNEMKSNKTINYNIGGNVGVLNADSPGSDIQNTMNILTDHELLDKVLEELRTIRGSADQQNSKEFAIIDGVLAEAPTNPQALERIKSISGWLVDHVDKVGTTLVAALLKGQLGI